MSNRNRHLQKSHTVMVSEWMKDPAFKAEYDALEDDFQLLRSMLLARKRAGLTQSDVAEKMGTKGPAIARLESTDAVMKHSPSIRTVRKYAQAVGCKLVTSFEPITKKSSKTKANKK